MRLNSRLRFASTNVRGYVASSRLSRSIHGHASHLIADAVYIVALTHTLSLICVCEGEERGRESDESVFKEVLSFPIHHRIASWLHVQRSLYSLTYASKHASKY